MTRTYVIASTKIMAEGILRFNDLRDDHLTTSSRWRRWKGVEPGYCDLLRVRTFPQPQVDLDVSPKIRVLNSDLAD